MIYAGIDPGGWGAQTVKVVAKDIRKLVIW